MKFLANENVPLSSIRFLREAGYRIDAIIENSPGIKDEEVLQRSAVEKSILLTFDRDYGELIFKRALPPPAGIIFFKPGITSEEVLTPPPAFPIVPQFQIHTHFQRIGS